MKLLCIVLCALAASVVLAIDPKFAQNYTLYHVNPERFGAIPVNMDTGDAAGDLYFDLREAILQPLLDPGSKNAEITDPSLMASKLVVEMDNRFSSYGACNVAPGPNGTYHCGCGYHNKEPCFDPLVGAQNITPLFGHHGQMGSYCLPEDTQARCWSTNAVEKFSAQQPGMWYSTLDMGYCGLHGDSRWNVEDVDRMGDFYMAGKNCTWRVVAVEKRVSLACRSDVFFSAVENINTTCFDACPSRQPGLKRSSSDPCWIGCFYKAVLGPDSDRPLKIDESLVPGATGVVAGIPLGSLTAMWEQAFDNETAGGCKPL
jgi:hypothetical protein